MRSGIAFTVACWLSTGGAAVFAAQAQSPRPAPAPATALNCKRPPELAGVLSRQPSGRAFNALGAYYAQRREFGCAIQAFESALKLEPGSWEARYNLALALLEKGSPRRAADELRTVIRQQPVLPGAHNALGTAYLRLGQKGAAEAEFRETLQVAPADIFAYQQLSEILIDDGRYAAAINLLAGAPKDPGLEANLAFAYSKNGKPEQALALLARLVEAQPDSALAHFNLATEQAHQKMYRDAAGGFREALRLDPKNDVARISLVKALNVLAEYTEALPLMEDFARRKPSDFDAPYLLGEVYRGLGRYADAAPLLERAVRMKPSHYDSLYNLGFVLIKEGRYQQAVTALNKAIAVRPEASEAHYQLGLAWRAMNQPERAKKEMEIFDQQRRQTGQRDVATVTAARASQYLTRGDARRAVETYQEALKLDPDNARTHYNLAVALERLGDNAGQRSALETALRLDDKLALAHNQLGLLDLKEGKTAGAEQHFKRALDLDPQYAEAQSNLGVLYGQKGMAKEAEALLRQATENNPNFAQAFVNLGLVLAAGGRLVEAEKELASAVRLAPANAPALTSLAMVEARAGKHDEAIANFRKVVALTPGSAEAHVNLGIALADHYELEAALGEFSDAVSLAPNLAGARYNKGRSLFDLKRYPEARAELEAACKLAPNYFEPLYLLALTEKQMDNPARTVELLERAVVLEPNDADAQYLLGQGLAKTHRPEKAVPHWKRAVAINPGHAEALYNLSRALLEKSPDEARQYSERFQALQKKRMVTDRSGTLANFAIAAANARDWQQAVEQMKEALEVCGECAKRGDLHKNLGLIYCRSGDLDNGEAELRLAQKDRPTDPDILRSLETIKKLKIKAAAGDGR
jgi:tetratricopeptide (TPR) repeat protein